MGNHSDTGDELDEIKDSGSTDPGANPSELDDNDGNLVRLNPKGDGPAPIKNGPSPDLDK